MRSVLGDPKAIVPANKAVVSAGYRLLVPVHHVEAAYVRSHFSSVEIGVQDAPRPNELLFALVMGTGPRVHARIGGLRADQISVARRTSLSQPAASGPRRSRRRSLNDETTVRDVDRARREAMTPPTSRSLENSSPTISWGPGTPGAPI